MIGPLDKSLLRRLPQVDPAIHPDALADSLCDGELLAVALDRWVLAQFRQFDGVIVNVAILSDPELPNRIRACTAKMDVREAQQRFNKDFDFEIINDPACPKPILRYLLESLAYLWQAQARLEFPDRKLIFRVGFDREGGIGGDYFIEMTSEEEDDLLGKSTSRIKA